MAIRDSIRALAIAMEDYARTKDAPIWPQDTPVDNVDEVERIIEEVVYACDGIERTLSEKPDDIAGMRSQVLSIGLYVADMFRILK